MKEQEFKPIASMSLFPTMDSLEDVFAFAHAKMPINNRNEVYAILAMYHNTILKKLGKLS